MVILGIGTDIVKNQRIQHILRRHPARFLQKVLHPTEIKQFESKKDDGQISRQCTEFVASRWALKEAMVKATQNRSLIFSGMYLYKPHLESAESATPNDKIQVKIDHPKNQEILDSLGVRSIHSSISHEDDYSIAFVVLEK
ncbi:unnamed protein product [Moneuplotes crassus]|uniref:4'-phosphopantetheinyl transferase domain-containing protein n=1 Tax=Euplotes crassus TaxID=5936 RepID=A0AAD2D8Z0_EUPCR|nr:unnamed protein product [Moneuplotes crassus]